MTVTASIEATASIKKVSNCCAKYENHCKTDQGIWCLFSCGYTVLYYQSFCLLFLVISTLSADDVP